MANQNWTGNRNSIFTTLGASNHTDKEREENDFYATDPIAVTQLIEQGGGVKLNQDIWECACGQGHLSEELKRYGYNVRSTDLIDRGYGESGIDFLSCKKIWKGDILTNPPYKLAQDFIEHALDIILPGNKVFMFLKLQFLEGKGRRKLFETKQLKTLYVSSSRILCAKNADFKAMKDGGGSAVAYGWYEFEKDYNGDPTIKWIN